MLHIDRYEHSWPDDVEPRGEGFDRESLATWSARMGDRFAHLEPRVVEQWIYKHGRHSPFSFLDVMAMEWRLERWTGRQIMDRVYCEMEVHAEHDFAVFNQYGGSPTSIPFDATGTWDYPIVILETPDGIQENGREMPHVRYTLIEGHQRRRYLNAKMARGEANEAHEVFVLRLNRPHERPERILKVEREAMKLSDGEKLIIYMLCGLHKAHGVQSGVDPDFIQRAISGGHAWAIKQKYSGIFAAREDATFVKEEVHDILFMWSLIEISYAHLDEAQLAELRRRLGRREPHFIGFDGNNERDHLSVAQVIVNELDGFESMRDKVVNSHMPTLDRYLAMHKRFDHRMYDDSIGGLPVDALVTIIGPRDGEDLQQRME